MSDDSTTAWLRDLEALRSLPQRYARAVDARDFDALGDLFDPAGSVEGVRGTAPVPAYLEGMRNAPSPFVGSMHLLGDPLVELEPGADRATSDTYAVVYQLRAPDAPEGDLTLGMRYLDTLARVGGTWKIHHRKASTMWMRGTLPG